MTVRGEKYVITQFISNKEIELLLDNYLLIKVVLSKKYKIKKTNILISTKNLLMF